MFELSVFKIKKNYLSEENEIHVNKIKKNTIKYDLIWTKSNNNNNKDFSILFPIPFSLL